MRYYEKKMIEYLKNLQSVVDNRYREYVETLHVIGKIK